jgi:glutamine amidotransferase
MKNVCIVDYSSGNIFSVTKAFEHFNCRVSLASTPEQISSADYLVLPGVGAFGDGMNTLRQRGLIEPMLEFVDRGKPFLGICLGMQLLLTSSEEFGAHQGLNLIPGQVRRLPAISGLKIPHVGWAQLQSPEGEAADCWHDSILDGVTQDRDMYFVHSYAAYPDDSEHWLSRTSFGNHWFCSTARKDNVSACQFHPEKSSSAGLSIVHNFLRQ